MAPVGRKPKPHLKIAIDAGALSSQDPRHQGGIYSLLVSLLTTFSHIDKRNSFVSYSFAPIAPKQQKLFGPRMINRVLPKYGYKSVWLRLALWWDKPDVFLAASQAMPKTNIPTLGFVYDLAFLKYSDKYHNFTRLKDNTEALVAKSRHIVTISEASKDDIIRVFHIPHKQISVYYPGVLSQYSPDGLKYVTTYPYFLYIGALKKTKNIPTLLTAFFHFLKKTSKQYRLILVGSDAHRDPEIDKTIGRLNLGMHVTYKGYVNTEELPKYYRGALAFISPALYEGFGLPILEAMACGTPVIGANNSAMPEVVGKAGLLIDELRPQTITEALEAMTDEKKRALYQKKALEQAQRFSEKKFAKGILDTIYSECLK